MPRYRLPPPLQPGDTIGVMAPSSYIDADALENGADFLRAKGYNILIHPQCGARLNQSAGTGEQKRDALHDLVRNPEVEAVFFAAGGNRALHILDLLDYKLIKKHPKIYMGFSDNTALLNVITAKTGIVTYHGPTVKRFPKNPQADFNLSLLSGKENSIPMIGARVLREGSAKGILIGGNLSLFRYLVGSGEIPNPKGAILFLEDISEEYSHIDRDFCYLRRCGLLEKIGGLVLGQFSDMRDTGTPFGFSFEDIIAEYTAGLDIPILTNAPFGHGEDLYALPIGAKAQIHKSSEGILQL
ncbi:MAG TPA: LD-carboxypeptidase [Micavibrio sp.]|nr:LD-carboxypeptidase [Micavibrio sp.]